MATEKAVVAMTKDPGPMARLQVVKDGAEMPSVIFQRLSDGETLAEIAKAMGLPKGRFVEWYTVTHPQLFDAAMKVRALDLAFEALEAAKAATPEDVSAKKLLADVALKLAGKFDRARFGETVRHETQVNVVADAGLIGFAGDLLAKFARRRDVTDATDAIEIAPGQGLEAVMPETVLLLPVGSPAQAVVPAKPAGKPVSKPVMETI